MSKGFKPSTSPAQSNYIFSVVEGLLYTSSQNDFTLPKADQALVVWVTYRSSKPWSNGA